VRELEAWGAAFDRTKDGKILQRNFGGHRYPRLAHVGDRTGLELIRTLQDHGIHLGMDVHMETTVVQLLTDGERIAGAVGYTRGHVGRCIDGELKAGRGSPHGGVFLDIAWTKKPLPNAEEHITKKLPSMYHQFKKLADLDVTREPREIGPSTPYVMGGVRVDA